MVPLICREDWPTHKRTRFGRRRILDPFNVFSLRAAHPVGTSRTSRKTGLPSELEIGLLIRKEAGTA